MQVLVPRLEGVLDTLDMTGVIYSNRMPLDVTTEIEYKIFKLKVIAMYITFLVVFFYHGHNFSSTVKYSLNENVYYYKPANQ